MQVLVKIDFTPRSKTSGRKVLQEPARNLTSHPNPERQGVKSTLTKFCGDLIQNPRQ